MIDWPTEVARAAPTAVLVMWIVKLQLGINECHKDRSVQAERIGKLEGFREAAETLGGAIEKQAAATEQVARSIDSWRPETDEYVIDRATGQLTKKVRQPATLPAGTPVSPPPIPRKKGP